MIKIGAKFDPELVLLFQGIKFISHLLDAFVLVEVVEGDPDYPSWTTLKKVVMKIWKKQKIATLLYPSWVFVTMPFFEIKLDPSLQNVPRDRF